MRGEWSDKKQELFNQAIEAFKAAHNRMPTQEEENDLWESILEME